MHGPSQEMFATRGVYFASFLSVIESLVNVIQ
jgi:hypothetical protein